MEEIFEEQHNDFIDSDDFYQFLYEMDLYSEVIMSEK